MKWNANINKGAQRILVDRTFKTIRTNYLCDSSPVLYNKNKMG